MSVLYIPGRPVFNETAPKQKIIKELQRHFKFDLTDRITVRADVNQFNYKEDESVWKQAREKAPHYMELYWDDVWICDFNEKELIEATVHKFLVGFRNAYESDQVHLQSPSEFKEQKERDHLDEQVKKIKAEMSEKTTEDKLAKKAVVELLEEKKEKRNKMRKKINSKLKG